MNRTLAARTLFATRNGLGLALIAWIAASCAGSNAVKVKENSSPISTHDYVTIVFQEEDPTVPLPVDLRATIKNQTSKFLEQTLSRVDGDIKRLQALGKMKDFKPRKLTCTYKVVGYDPGTPMLRQILGYFGVGAAHLLVDLTYTDESGKTIGDARLAVELADKGQILVSDTEIMSALFLQGVTDYYLKNYKPDYNAQIKK
jgi:hypothetical protein